MKLSYSLGGASEASDLSKTHLSDAIKAGRLKSRKSGPLNEKGEPTGKYVILRADLEAYLEGLETA